MSTLLAILNQRKCGPCRECCTHPDLREWISPIIGPCPHVSEEGCSIQQIKPLYCKEWSCWWLLGNGKPEERPDLTGIVIYPNGVKKVKTKEKRKC